MPDRQAIVLIGMPGAGKTTIGRALAERLGWEFVDTDEVVDDDVPGLIEREGIYVFRAREMGVIDRLSEHVGERVISVGGGAVVNESNRHRLKALGPVVWLRATLQTLLERVGDGEGRPLLDGDAEAALKRLLVERLPVYETMPDVIVDVDGLDPSEAAAEIEKALT